MSVWPQINCKGRKLGYARVSTRDQKLRMQRDVLEEISCDLIFEDHGFSGSTDKRPGLDELLRVVQPDDTVVVFKLDRLGRSVLHLADLLVRFQRDGIHFCSWSEGINTTTPGGKLVYHLFSAFAEFQREVIIENTQQGLDAARRRGQKLGRPPLLTPDQIVFAHQAVMQRGEPCEKIAKRMGVSRMTLSRGFKRLELEA